MSEQKSIFLSAQRNPNNNDPQAADIFEIGTIANILQILKLTDGTMKVLVEGLQRGRIESFKDNSDYFEVDVIRIHENDQLTPDVKAMMRSVGNVFEQYVKLNQKIPLEAVAASANILEPQRYADTIASYMVFQTQEKQELLETLNPADRLNKLLGILKSEMEVLKIEKRVHGRVRKQMERSQKEFYLNEQMKAIQKELGKRDEFKSDFDELKQKIKKAKMPKEVGEKAKKELKRLELMQPMSAEATVARTYIEWLTDIPWGKAAGTEKIKISEAQKVLDADHYGLEKVKERITEHLAVVKLVKKIKGPIICLVGPPGVGKTSLGKSIGKAMGRKFVRISLGGVRDEAEIRGHRRTYIGALPGKIIQGMKKAGTKNPVFLLDEIDKITSRSETSGSDVSRQGVQRDLLPLVEGTTISTKYGMIKTDHILFIASGAFHLSKPSDLIPELQGRFPIRVELASLNTADFVQILTNTDACLTRQYEALMKTEKIKLEFLPEAIQRLAEIAFEVNEKTENIGARRLHTVMEKLLEEVSFDASKHSGTNVSIDSSYVDKRLKDLSQREDLARYVL